MFCGDILQPFAAHLYPLPHKLFKGTLQNWQETKIVKITDLHETYRSNDDDSRKHPLKYLCLKFHIC